MSVVDVGALVPVRQLGRGALSEVLLVEDAGGQRYALKRALAQYRRDPRVLRLLREEARVCGALAHPNIPRLIAFAEESAAGEGCALVFEFVDGLTLDAAVPAKQAVAAAEALFVADTLLAAVIHRDIGPHNVMVARSGDPALIDFGIAKDEGRERMTATGAVRGAAGYLSPEAVRAEPLDARADLFSLGALLYRLLTGTGPFRGRGPRQVLEAIASGTFAAASSIAAPLAPFDAFFARALAARPEHRFTDAAAMRAELGRVVDGTHADASAVRRAWASRVMQLRPAGEDARGPTRA